MSNPETESFYQRPKEVSKSIKPIEYNDFASLASEVVEAFDNHRFQPEIQIQNKLADFVKKHRPKPIALNEGDITLAASQLENEGVKVIENASLRFGDDKVRIDRKFILPMTDGASESKASLILRGPTNVLFEADYLKNKNLLIFKPRLFPVLYPGKDFELVEDLITDNLAVRHQVIGLPEVVEAKVTQPSRKTGPNPKIQIGFESEMKKTGIKNFINKVFRK